MSKTNKAQIIALCNQINKKQGDGTIYTIGSEHANLKIDRWSTGIADLDEIIGGGMPEGRVVEVYGAEGAGKTSLVYHLCAQHELALYCAAEGTYDEERAKTFGNTPKQLLVHRPRYGEDAFNKTLQFSKAGIPVIAVDSVPSLVPKDDIEKVIKSADKDSIEEQKIGGVARLMNKYLPPIEEVIENTGTTIIYVNQIRDKIGALMFGEQTNTPGGHKLKHACSLRIQCARRAWIEIPNKNPNNSANTEKVGIILKCKVVKSKVCNPLGECEIPMFFDRGFVSFDDVPSIRKELMDKAAEKYSKRKKKDSEEETEEFWEDE